MNNPKLLENLRVIPDFPKPGIMFQDISTLFDKPECLKIMCKETCDLYKDKGITKILGILDRKIPEYKKEDGFNHLVFKVADFRS